MYAIKKLLSGITVVIFAVTYILIHSYAIAGDIPNYNGSVGSAKPKECDLFNQFMLKNKGKTVHISISLDAEQQDSFKSPEPYTKNEKRFIFTVPIMEAGRHMGGNEYLIHVPATAKDYKFEYTKNTGQLSGYFMIYNIQSSAGGIMSVNLRPMLVAGQAAIAGEPSQCQGVTQTKGEKIKNKAELERAITKQLKDSLLKDTLPKLKSVTLLFTWARDNWTIFFVQTHVSDEVYLFYSGNPLTSRYVTHWRGWAEKNEEPEIKVWVLKNAPGIPPKLAGCFARDVTH